MAARRQFIDLVDDSSDTDAAPWRPPVVRWRPSGTLIDLTGDSDEPPPARTRTPSPNILDIVSDDDVYDSDVAMRDIGDSDGDAVIARGDVTPPLVGPGSVPGAFGANDDASDEADADMEALYTVARKRSTPPRDDVTPPLVGPRPVPGAFDDDDDDADMEALYAVARKRATPARAVLPPPSSARPVPRRPRAEGVDTPPAQSGSPPWPIYIDVTPRRHRPMIDLVDEEYDSDALTQPYIPPDSDEDDAYDGGAPPSPMLAGATDHLVVATGADPPPIGEFDAGAVFPAYPNEENAQREPQWAPTFRYRSDDMPEQRLAPPIAWARANQLEFRLNWALDRAGLSALNERCVTRALLAPALSTYEVAKLLQLAAGHWAPQLDESAYIALANARERVYVNGASLPDSWHTNRDTLREVLPACALRRRDLLACMLGEITSAAMDQLGAHIQRAYATHTRGRRVRARVYVCPARTLTAADAAPLPPGSFVFLPFLCDGRWQLFTVRRRARPTASLCIWFTGSCDAHALSGPLARLRTLLAGETPPGTVVPVKSCGVISDDVAGTHQGLMIVHMMEVLARRTRSAELAHFGHWPLAHDLFVVHTVALLLAERKRLLHIDWNDL